MEKKSTRTRSTAEAGPAVVLPGRPWWDPVRLGRRSLFPFLLQAISLAVLVAMISIGWGRHGIAGVTAEGPLLYTNLATLGFWVVWFMVLILFFPLIGRLWCTVCPVGGCNDLFARLGAKRAYPRRLQNLFLMGVMLLLLSLVAELYSFNRYPDYTAALLLGVLLTAVAAGLVFRGRVFCRFWCPIGGMAGLYSRISPVEIGSRSHEICRGCESKACYTGSSRWYRLAWSGWQTVFPFRRPGCPAFIFPPEAATSENCLMCTQCLKNCPYDNLRWGTRPLFSGLWRGRVRDRSEVILVMVLTGIVFYRLARFWSDLRVIVEWPASFAAAHLSFVGPAAFKGLKLLAGFGLWPLLFFTFLALAAKALSEISLTPWPEGGEKTTGLLYDVAEIDEQRRREQQGWEARKHTVPGYLAAYSCAFLPLLGGAYGAFALIKLNEKLGYLPLALGDPAGVRSYLSMNELLILSPPESLVPLGWVRWGALALVAAGVVISLWSVRRVGTAVYGPGSPPARRGGAVFGLGIIILASLMLVCLRAWLFRG